MRGEVNGFVVTQAEPPLPATPGRTPRPSLAESPTRPRAPPGNSRRPRGLVAQPWRLAARRDWCAPGAGLGEALGAKAGTDAPRRRGVEARPHPPRAEAVLLWLSSRGKQRNLSGLFPTLNPEREKPETVCSRGDVECDTARHPVPSCGLPEPLPVAAFSLPWNLRNWSHPEAAPGLYLIHHPKGTPARPTFGLR